MMTRVGNLVGEGTLIHDSGTWQIFCRAEMGRTVDRADDHDEPDCELIGPLEIRGTVRLTSGDLFLSQLWYQSRGAIG
jgi:hypothetical protein